MLKPDIEKLKDIIRILPKGTWTFYPDIVSGEDPLGNSFTLSSVELDEVQQKLYLDVSVTLFNYLEPLINHMEWLQQRSSGFEAELDHFRNRSKRVYNRALEDIEKVIHSIEIHSPTARDALNLVVTRMQELYNLDQIPSKEKIVPPIDLK